jgi:hypothetical protein
MVLEKSPYLTTSWAEVASYSDNSMSHTVKTSVSGDGIVSYAEYRFRLKNVNAYGSSAYSEEVILAVAPLPSAPLAPTKN